jgi:hypothetical protein
MRHFKLVIRGTTLEGVEHDPRILALAQGLGGTMNNHGYVVTDLAWVSFPDLDEAEDEVPGETPEFVPYAQRSKDDLAALAADRGLVVERAEGEGAPLKADYVRALEAADEEE